jgi:hypothetical protein
MNENNENGNGTMQKIRELLYKGKTVPEIIAQGYSPSTAYRVQRDARRKSGLLGITPYRKESANYGLKHFEHLETENQRLHRRLDSMESQLAAIAEDEDIAPLWEGLADLQPTLEKLATRQEQITRQLQTHNAIIGKIDAELDALAQVFKKDVWLGEPKWQRQITKK